MACLAGWAMGVRLPISYSSLARMNGPLDIGLISVTTECCFRVRNRHGLTSSGAAAHPGIRVTRTTTVCAVVIVTENAPESITDVGSAVQTRRVIDRWTQRGRHADHPVSATNFAGRRRPGTSDWFESGSAAGESDVGNWRLDPFRSPSIAEAVSATVRVFCGWALTDSNHRPLGYEPSALTGLS